MWAEVGQVLGDRMTRKERIAEAICRVAGGTSGCYSDKCCCNGVEAFECQTGIAVDELVEAVELALDTPSQITPNQAGS